ncbi:uncharacterized protein LOC111263100 [Varroa jacobsoni]|uniref:uncharacterized protein LOC111263100 n=1 Tax=Varroa jacobsoni TaxID=62625 RepID=UPI000BF802D8|nr:uncharacterized protein LOC111263100 [Varroa jacobsoni]
MKLVPVLFFSLLTIAPVRNVWAAHGNYRLVSLLKLSVWTHGSYCFTRKCEPAGYNHSHKPWTIFGLIPLQPDGKRIPTNCSDVKLNFTTLKPILPELIATWPSFTSEKPEHVWERRFKHFGQCAISHDETAMVSAYDYFKTAILLYDGLKIDENFKLGGISQNNITPVSLSRINWLFNGQNKAIEFYCEGNRSGYDVLQRMKFCYHPRSLRAISCPKIANERPTCKTKQVWYLTNPAGDQSKASDAIRTVNTTCELVMIAVLFYTLLTLKDMSIN